MGLNAVFDIEVFTFPRLSPNVHLEQDVEADWKSKLTFYSCTSTTSARTHHPFPFPNHHKLSFSISSTSSSITTARQHLAIPTACSNPPTLANTAIRLGSGASTLTFSRTRTSSPMYLNRRCASSCSIRRPPKAFTKRERRSGARSAGSRARMTSTMDASWMLKSKESVFCKGGSKCVDGAGWSHVSRSGSRLDGPLRQECASPRRECRSRSCEDMYCADDRSPVHRVISMQSRH